MKIYFISPAVNFTTTNKDLQDFWFNFSQNHPHRNIWSGVGIGLLNLAALTPDKWDVEFTDENISPINYSKEYDIIAISIMMTQQANHAYDISTRFRKLGVTVILGGIHVTLVPNEAKNFANAIVVGEAEGVWSKILIDFERLRLKEIYKDENLFNMNNSIIPRYELLTNSYQFIWIQASRGCPHDCNFCTASKIFGKGIRYKKISQIRTEIEYIKRIFPNKPLSFSDDNIFADKKWASQFIDEMSCHKTRWQAQTDISIGMSNKDFMNRLYLSGCNLLFIGYESLDPNSLKLIDNAEWKAKQVSNYSNWTKYIQESGIGIMGAFIVGFDHDTIQVFNSIRDFVYETKLYHSTVTILTPFPGTKIRDSFLAQGRLVNNNWDDYTGYNVTFKLKNMTHQELNKSLVDLYNDLYNDNFFERKMEYFKTVQKDLKKRSL